MALLDTMHLKGGSVPLGWVQIETVPSPPRYSVRCLLGEEGPKVTEGYGGFEEVERPRKRPATRWKGGLNYKMSVPVVLDGWMNQKSVEPEIRQLEAMARVAAGEKPPYRITVQFFGSTPRSRDVEWVIDTIEWGDALWQNRRIPGTESIVNILPGRVVTPVTPAIPGERLRQAATLNLIQWTPLEVLVKQKKRRRGSRRGQGGPARVDPVTGGTVVPSSNRSYVVRSGDTLPRIASRLDTTTAAIRAENPGVRDRVRPGQRLKVPV